MQSIYKTSKVEQQRSKVSHDNFMDGSFATMRKADIGLLHFMAHLSEETGPPEWSSWDVDVDGCQL